MSTALATVTDTLMKSAAERSLGLGWDGLARAWARATARRDHDAEPVGAELPDRRSSYEAMRRAAVQYRVGLGVLASGPPSVVGALWTYPVHLGALGRSPAQAAALLDGFLAVQADGRGEVVDAAVELLTALNEATGVYVSQWDRPKPERQQPILDALGEVDEALVAYTLAVRSDLGHDEKKRRKAPQ